MNKLISSLEINSLTNKNIRIYCKEIENINRDNFLGKETIKKQDTYKNLQNNTTTELFIPKYRDKLFWCFYIIENGYMKYETIHNAFITEKNNKIEICENLRKKKDIIKMLKIKKNILDNNLCNEEKISLLTFINLCRIFNYSFLILNGKIGYSNIIKDSKDTFLILKDGVDYGLYSDESKKTVKIKRALENNWIITNFKKPLKGISSYKIAELKEICNKLDINIIKKKKKELYNLIQEKL
jgi:hypothetical protein